MLFSDQGDSADYDQQQKLLGSEQNWPFPSDSVQWSSYSQLGSEVSPEKKKVAEVEERKENQDSTKAEDMFDSMLNFVIKTEKPRSYSSKEAHQKLEDKTFDAGGYSDNRKCRLSNITESIPEISEHDDSSSLVGEDLNSKMLSIMPLDKLEARVASTNTDDKILADERHSSGVSNF